MIARVLVALALLAAPALGQSSIALRPRASVPAPGTIRLDAVAEIRGEDAQRLAGVTVGEIPSSALAAPGAAGEVTLTAAGVQAILRRERGVNWGRIAFSGAACAVRVAADRPPAPSVQRPTPPAPQGPTVRDHVSARVAEVLAAAPDHLKLTFDESQGDVLDVSSAGRAVVVQPAGVGERMTLTVRVFEGERPIASGSVRVGVQVKRAAAVAVADMSKGHKLDVADVSSDEAWVAPGVVLADPAKLAGSVLKERVEHGRPILARSVESPVVVKKGDAVAVDCVSGTFVVRALARALGPAREGDIVELQSDRGKERFRAKVTGPGAAIIVVETPAPPRPMTVQDAIATGTPVAADARQE